jgi:hypothetical protein
MTFAQTPLFSFRQTGRLQYASQASLHRSHRSIFDAPLHIHGAGQKDYSMKRLDPAKKAGILKHKHTLMP